MKEDKSVTIDDEEIDIEKLQEENRTSRHYKQYCNDYLYFSFFLESVKNASLERFEEFERRKEKFIQEKLKGKKVDQFADMLYRDLNNLITLDNLNEQMNRYAFLNLCFLLEVYFYNVKYDIYTTEPKRMGKNKEISLGDLLEKEQISNFEYLE